MNFHSTREIFDGVSVASTFHFGPCLACATAYVTN